MLNITNNIRGIRKVKTEREERYVRDHEVDRAVDGRDEIELVDLHRCHRVFSRLFLELLF